MNYDHLFPDTAQVMEKTDEEKIEFLRKDFFLEYASATEILTKLNDLLNYPRVSRMPCYSIIGDPNFGKTGLVSHFCKLNPPDDGLPGDVIKFPVLMVQAPVVPDEKRFYRLVLKTLNCPFKYNSPTDKLETQVMEVLSTIRPKIIIIDEIHNLIAGSLDKQKTFMNVLKNMHNSLQIPFVGVGTTKALTAIRVDAQLESRFQTLRLPKWKYDNDFKNFILSVEHAMPLPKPSDLDEDKKSIIIYQGSEGVLGRIIQIIRDATVYCILNRKKRITSEILTNLK